ncbi:MAG: hypothetical protein GY788_12285 [bacterium]|nr:hypothetical protein [bacterium]
MIALSRWTCALLVVLATATVGVPGPVELAYHLYESALVYDDSLSTPASTTASTAVATTASATNQSVRQVPASNGDPRYVSDYPYATNELGGLGDDFGRALDEIDAGVSRPNVRNPNPFPNDGRGGTARLPDADSQGSLITYTEHTVNPRPPGGSLDGRRIVTGSDGSVWATTDHFETWSQVR